MRISIDKITPNADQPRKLFSPEGLERLAATIKAKGLIQPIKVRPIEGGRYQIVAGERRWRAHGILRARFGEAFGEIECIVETMDIIRRDVEAIIENFAREDITPIEESDAFQRLADEHGMSAGQIAVALGITTAVVDNRLMLQRLAPEIRKLAETGQIESSNARCVSRLDNPADQVKVVQAINRGELPNWRSVKAAVESIIEKTTVVDLFGDAPTVNAADMAGLTAMERKVQSVIGMIGAGWKDGECVVASKVNPDRAGKMADQLAALRTTLGKMERDLRAVQAQVAFAA